MEKKLEECFDCGAACDFGPGGCRGQVKCIDEEPWGADYRWVHACITHEHSY